MSSVRSGAFRRSGLLRAQPSRSGPRFAVKSMNAILPAQTQLCPVESSSRRHVHLPASCRASFWRGGTSKGIFLNERDLPAWLFESAASKRPIAWEDHTVELSKLIGPMMGSPDANLRQLNGMGGGISSLSKAVIVRPSTSPGADVEYTFMQVGIKDRTLDMVGNCGNLSSVVGPYAINEEISKPAYDKRDFHNYSQGEGSSSNYPVTLRLRNTNTKKLIDATFRVYRSQGQLKFQQKGDYTIDGVSGKASPIILSFVNPGGAKTGKIFPTGHAIDEILVGTETFRASLVDITNPGVFLNGRDVGWDPEGSPDKLNEDSDLLNRLETIRKRGAEMMGMDPGKGAVPKIVLVYPPDTAGIDIRCQALSMEKAHKAVPGTLALNLGAACQIAGTIPYELARRSGRSTIMIGHPSGLAEVGAQIEDGEVKSVSLGRTARCLMEGYINTSDEEMI